MINEQGLLARSRSQLGPLGLVSVAYAVLVFRLFRLIYIYAVNIFFWDQWDFNNPTLFQPKPLWQVFTYQHGPHRQGLGALVAMLVGWRSHWNTRSEAFTIGVIVVLASLSALFLKKRLYGCIRYSDVMIPMIFFTRVQYDTYLGTTNPSHGSLPLLLMMLYCLAWTIQNDLLKYPFILVINFLMIYTGFGLFVGFITPVLLAFDGYKKVRGIPQSNLWHTIVAWIISVASIASFFIGYVQNPAAEALSFASKHLMHYLLFMDLMFARFLAVKGQGFSLIVGALVLAILLVVLLVHLGRILIQQKEGNTSMIIVALLSYPLLFAMATAIGRVSLGLDAARSSRYMIYLVPAFLGIYFHALSLHQRPRRALVTVLLVALLLASFPTGLPHRGEMDRFGNGKLNWKNCYLRLEDIEQCNTLTGFKIFPAPEPTQLKDKLNYLKQRKLNLYAD